MSRKHILTLAVTVLFSLVAASAQAAEYLPKSKTAGGNVAVGGSAALTDLYVAGLTVTINKGILGDLLAAGSSLSVDGSVQKDLFGVGGNVNVSQPIGEDARLAGGNVSVGAPIGGDLLIGACTVSLSESATVGGDLWVAGGAINLSGRVSGEARITGGQIYINSAIGGPLTVRADEKLIFGPGANVPGPISYHGKEEAVVEDGAVIGTVSFTRLEHGDKAVGAGPAWGAYVMFLIMKAIAVFIAVLVALKLFRTKIIESVTLSYSRPWGNLGLGLASLILGVIGIVILALTLIGLYLSLALSAIFAFLVLAAGAVSVLFTGYIIEKLFRRGVEVIPTWKTALWGALACAILSLIPYLGCLAMFVLFLISFGALLRVSRRALEV